MTVFNFEMMAALLRETEQEHAKVEKSLPEHEWQDWYAAYMVQRMKGEAYTREIAAQAASYRVKEFTFFKQSVTQVPVSESGVTIIDGSQKLREDFIESQT